MAFENTNRGNNLRRRLQSVGRFPSEALPEEITVTGSDAALKVQSSGVHAPEGEAAQEETVPVVSTVYDGTPLGQRIAFRSREAWDYIRGMSLLQWLWIGVFILATILRFWDLGGKPLHHDESEHAYFSLQFARYPAGYEYDPLLHGPFQFHAEGLVFRLILIAQSIFHVGSASGNPWINDGTARILPAAFGVGIVLLPLGLRREIGRVGAWVAALLLAVSPSFVYFSRFLREDIYFNFFMFAIVVCAVQFAHKRTIRWLVATFVSLVLAYATFEGTYLMLVIFLSFLVVLALWEVAYILARRLPRELSPRERLFFSRAGLLLALGAAAGSGAYKLMNSMHSLNAYITASNANMNKADAQVQQLENTTVVVLLYVSIAVAVVVIGALIWQVTRDDAEVRYAESLSMMEDGDNPPPTPYTPLTRRIERVFSAPGRALSNLRDQIDPDEKPFLHMLLGISWVHWFVACVAAWIVFAALYWVLPPGPTGAMSWGEGFQVGVGRGIWQGLYYWIQQQQVARGGQPFYYYLLLLPLYEQLAVVFGLAGAVYSLFRPTHFRLFLVWWFVLSLGIYSWAGEKMPWLSIHILLPLMLLAAVVITRVIQACADLAWKVRYDGVRGLVMHTRPLDEVAFASSRAKTEATDKATDDEVTHEAIGQSGYGARVSHALWRGYHAVSWRSVGTVVTAALALLLFIPMVHSMYELAYVDPADGPLEMMVYVQTTTDVTAAMAKIDAADQKLHKGNHQLNIWVGSGEEWPFYWYLRDYYLDPHPGTYVTFDPASMTDKFAPGATVPDVLLLLPSDAQAFMQAHPGYTSKEYKLRSWWDEAYKLPLCTATVKSQCTPSADWGTGVGLGDYLTYGSNPPPNATFNLGKATNRLWNWLWFRQPLGSTNGSYDFTLVVRNGIGIKP